MTTGFGIKIKSGDDRLMIDRNGMLQTWADSVADNLDNTHPMFLRFYLPEETMSVQEISLSFQTHNFRSYTLQTGTATVTAFPSENVHNHSWSLTCNVLEAGPHAFQTNSTSGGPGTHQHTYQIRRISSAYGGHTHSVSGSASPGGTHSHGTLSHAHGLVFGINNSSLSPGTISLAIQKGSGSFSSISYSNPDDINLLPFLNQNDLPGWYTIRFSGPRVGRVTASYMIQAMISVDSFEEG